MGVQAYPIQRARVGGGAGIDAYLASAPVPAQLVFTTQPGGAVVNTPFTQQPVVEVRDAGGNVIPSFTGNVTMAIWNGGGALAGTTTVAAVAGVATFTNLQINTTAGLVQLSPTITGIGGGASLSDYFLNDIPGTYAARLQTHAGDNVPLGLWQDVAMTIPATMDGDPIAAWSDELSASGIVAIQADTQKQGLLVFVDGVPTVLLDGVDDFYAGALATNSVNFSIFCGVQINTQTGGAVAYNGDPSANGWGLYQSASRGVLFGGVALRNDGAVTGDWELWSAVGESGVSLALYVDSVSQVIAVGTANTPTTGILIGSGSGNVTDGSLTSVLMLASLASDPNRAIIEPYLIDLNPA